MSPATRATVPTALTIAGSDPSGGAGIQADLKTFASLGVYGTTAITALTVQNTVGVRAVHPVPCDVVAAQIEAVAADIFLHATKIGMLATAAIVSAVAKAIADYRLPQVVIDPVIGSTSGTRLLDEEGVQALCTELLPRACLVTPNIPEAERLAGQAVRTVADMREAARRIHDMGAAAVLVTGGHLEGPMVVDVLFDGVATTELRAPRIETPHTHGSGCTLAAAVAAHLALGYDLVESVGRAQTYVIAAIKHALAIGRGHGPLGHFQASVGP